MRYFYDWDNPESVSSTEFGKVNLLVVILFVCQETYFLDGKYVKRI